ncbi:MAG: ribosomal protein L7/L12, partial [Epsilonproteobacteria bacterium]|nr:ribosomal protein L7/L12 [Campylobacterota bacterium]
AAAPVEEEEEKKGPTDVNLVLKAVGMSKVAVIKAVQAITGLGLMDAKKLVDGAPVNIKEHISPVEAEEHKKALVAAGAEVEVK